LRYRDNREQSAELLRMVLPLMSRHPASFSPLSYAIWYEYSAGLNRPLRAAVDAHVARGGLLDDGMVQSLFDQYVAMRDIESTAKLRVRIQEVVDEVGSATNEASAEVGRYNAGLGNAQQKLQQALEPQAVTALIDGLMGDTTRVLERTTQLEQNLKATAQEARRLGLELETARGQAQTDPLTGLLNRRGLEVEVTGSHPGGLPQGVLMFIAIEHLDQLATQYGHLLADRAIAAVAQIVVSTAGITARVARTGSGEFAVLLNGTSPQVAHEQAARIRTAVEKCRIRRQDNETPVEAVSVAVGIGVVAQGDALSTAVGRAEQALRDAQAGGASRIAVVAP
jgi:diguanylate cyclase